MVEELGSEFLQRCQLPSLLDRGENDFGPLYAATTENNVVMAGRAVAAGADVKAGLTEDSTESPPLLHDAAFVGNVEAAERLLTAGFGQTTIR